MAKIGEATIEVELDTTVNNKSLSPEANERVAALTEAQGILTGPVFFGNTGIHGERATYTADVVYLAEYILNGLEDAIVEEIS